MGESSGCKLTTPRRWLENGRSLGMLLFALVGWGMLVIVLVHQREQEARVKMGGGWASQVEDWNANVSQDWISHTVGREHMGGSSRSAHVDAQAQDMATVQRAGGGGGDPTRLKVVRKKAGGSGAKRCATVEEMGEVAAGDSTAASLRLRQRIKTYLWEHGAERVKSLPADQFCRTNFVTANFEEAGFGNSMYRFLTAAGLALMLNRSLIIGELRDPYLRNARQEKDDRPFVSYLTYSNQTLRMPEVQRLWAEHDCAGLYKRRLVVKIDSFSPLSDSSCLCSDWTQWPEPIMWFKETTDVVGLQYLLKNQHPAVRTAAGAILGDSRRPASRPNVFGELMHALVEPGRLVQEAVQWALQGGPDPDVSLHLRMRSSRSDDAVTAALKCVSAIAPTHGQGSRLRLLVLSDTPSVIAHIRQALGKSVEVLQFRHEPFVQWSRKQPWWADLEAELLQQDQMQVPRHKQKDWGAMPRWVALVDFYLAARARHAVVSAAYQRVATTYAQLIASLAAAARLADTDLASPSSFKFYSSFHSSLLHRGLSLQSGLGHSWRPFAGPLSCQEQPPQCARTPLLSYAWWDLRWQSPTPRELARMLHMGIAVLHSGHIPRQAIVDYCAGRSPAVLKVIKIQPL